MLQFNKAQSGIPRDTRSDESFASQEALQSLMGLIRRQLPVIVFVVLFTTALGTIYAMTARPSFTAQAQLLIDARKLQVFQQQSILGDVPIDTAQVESQVEILKSENVVSSVIKNLHLTDDPEFVGSGGGLIGTLFSAISNLFSTADQPEAQSEFELTRRAIGTFQSRLSIKRVGITYVIQIGFRSFDAERAAEIANAVADAYILDQLEAKYQATRRASAWLQDRIKELRDQVSASERAVVDFKTKNEIVSTGLGTGTDKRLLGEQQLAELSSQLIISRANTAETKAKLDQIDSVLKAGLTNGSIGATVTDTLKNEVVSKLRSQYLELAARQADWSIRYGPDHLAVVNLRNQLREIRNSIFEELKRLGETYKSDYAIAKQREAGLQTELTQTVAASQATDAKSVTLRELQSTAQTYKTLYDNFLQRYMESVQQQSFPISEARLISSASRPLGKSHPRTKLILAAAALGGLIIGFGIGIARDLLDRVFRSSEQIENLLQTDCIALIPYESNEKTNGDDAETKSDQDVSVGSRGLANSLISRSSEAFRSLSVVSDLHGTFKSTTKKFNAFTSSLSEQANDAASSTSLDDQSADASSVRARTIMRNSNALWTVVDAPLSRYTEAIRSIKLANDLNGVVKPNRVLGFTSSLPNEGKSTIAFSVAQLMAQAQVGGKTILVDCDLRNPSLTRMLAPDAKAGLLEVLAEKTSLKGAIWKDPSTNLSFLPVVSKLRLAHSSEILGSTPLKKLFEQLRETYDHVIVDLSPLAPIVDVRATAHLLDSFVFVIEWGRTKIDIVEHALAHAPGIYDNLLGVVLNKVDMHVFGRYANHRENYYYNKHYARYGYTE
jgi:succinoglycan biosynthesis transport protein ExoP